MFKSNILEMNVFPLLWGIGIFAVIAAIVIIVIVMNRKPKSKIKVDDEFIDSIISYYGGSNNIGTITVDNARLKVEVNDLDLVDLEQLKANSEAGVFVTGNIIKTLFRVDSQTIKSAIEKRK